MPHGLEFLMTTLVSSANKTGLDVEKKKPTRCHLKTLLFLGTAQHISDTHMPIIRSLRHVQQFLRTIKFSSDI
jgi:hypothetical protein